MVKVIRKYVPVLAALVVSAGGAAALQLTRQRAVATVADSTPTTAAPGTFDLAAPQLVRPVEPQHTAPPPARRPVVSMASTPFPQEYRILLTRSVFSNETDRRASRGPGSGQTDGARSYESSLTFRGAMREGSQFVAFIEDNGSNRTMRLKIGEKLGRGEIRQISLNQIIYQVGELATPVEIGGTLSGTGIASTTQPAPSSIGQAASASPSSSTTGGDDLLERMRKRRQLEGGG